MPSTSNGAPLLHEQILLPMICTSGFQFYQYIARYEAPSATMKSTITPEKALAFTKLSVLLTAIWPPDKNANNFKIKMADVVWCSSVISSTCLLIPLLTSINAYKDNPVIVSKSICLSCAVTQVIIKSIVCRIYRRKLQV